MDSRREDFEKWARDNGLRYDDLLDELTATAWQAWSAAIDSLVVELPNPSTDNGSVDLNYHEVTDALTKAGIKYK